MSFNIELRNIPAIEKAIGRGLEEGDVLVRKDRSSDHYDGYTSTYLEITSTQRPDGPTVRELTPFGPVHFTFEISINEEWDNIVRKEERTN